MAISSFVKRMIFGRALEIEEGELKMMGMEMFTMYAPAFIELHEKIRLMGQEGEEILYEQGKEAGRMVVKSVPIQMQSTKIFKLGMEFMDISGWGKMEVTKMDKEGNCIYRSSNSKIAKYILKKKGKQKKPVCIYVLGVAVGSYEEMFDVPVNGKETNCIAKGDPYCEFTVYPKKKSKIYSKKGKGK